MLLGLQWSDFYSSGSETDSENFEVKQLTNRTTVKDAQ